MVMRAIGSDSMKLERDINHIASIARSSRRSFAVRIFYISSTIVDPFHPWPIMFFGKYSSSKYLCSSSANSLLLTCNASSTLSRLLNPMIGLLTPLCSSHDNATWLIVHPFFLANSSTRPTIFLSASDRGGAPVDRVVVPLTLNGRARLPCARGPH